MSWIFQNLIRRREFFAAAGVYGCVGFAASTAVADPRSAIWSSQVVRLPPAAGRNKPPVVTALALHPQQRLLAIGGDDHLVRVWDLADERFVYQLDDHSDWVRALMYSPDGALLASAGNDRRLILWDATTGVKQSEQRSSGRALTAVHFAGDSAEIACVGFGDTLRVYDVARGKLLRELGCPCVDMRALTVSPDGERFAGGGRNGRIRVWDSRSGEVTGEYSAHRQRIRGLAFSPDSRLLASCGEDRIVNVFPLETGQGFALPSQPSKVMSLVFCGPNRLATGGSDNLVRIWDLNQRVDVDHLTGHTGSVAALAYNGEVLVSGGYDTTVRVWRMRPNVAGEDSLPTRRVGDLRGGRFGSQ